MKKIYIVDDDRGVVEAISIVLEKEGYAFKAQYNDKNVVENVKEYSPDAIILDVIFPEDEGAGFKIARKLKNEPATQKIPIMMLSAINEKGIYAGTFSNKDIDDTYLPVNDFVEKPIKPKPLIAKLEMLLKS